MAARSLEQLSSIVSRNAAALSKKLESQNASSPTVQNIDGPSLSEIDSAAANELANAARELQALVQSPRQQLNLLAFSLFDSTAVGTLLEFNVPELVPLEGTISLSELATKSGLLEDKLTRIVRYATTIFIFHEPKPGHIAHTALSATLARDSKFGDFLRLCLVDLAPINAALPEALRKWPQTEAIKESAVQVAFNTELPWFQWLSSDKTKQERFDKGMSGFSRIEGNAAGRSGNIDIAAYPWGKSLPSDAVVVDVGGGFGHFSKALAAAFPSFKITVQDREEVISVAREAGPSPVEFQIHSFWDPNPLKGADAYFLRQVIHDWPRKEAIDILRALTPALKPGARVLISEFMVPELADDDLLEAKMIREMDLQMMAITNAKERTKDEVVELFTGADSRFRFNAVHQSPEDRKVCIFEAIWEP
ncbi:S-adenosyl-L-methionine-dependent methyltransferase [Xylaria flabelliformis]|nr:S-adenosyl-L-methionine-dependent methyltransferase [Xylaria flabelliformis]